MTSESILRGTTRAPFRIPLTEAEMAGLLRDSYRAQVTERRGLYHGDAATEGKIAKVAEWLTGGTRRPMLMLQGSAGNGKTTMMLAVLRTLRCLKRSIQEIERGAHDGTGRYGRGDEAAVAEVSKALTGQVTIAVSATEMVRRITQDPNRSEGYSGCDLLFIDDFGRETVTAKHFGSDLFPIVDVLCRRYDTMSPTIVTTNLTDADIANIYGERVADRFREVFDRLAYTEKSFRQ